ncbi:MAG: DUF1684 domain-containing protein [Chloroflexi bacterium]|nr:DUF1684 domain-containing protein [Chloroflexota bacterium]
MLNLAEFRSEKDGFFGRDENSPLTDGQRSRFKGLLYFDEALDLAFRVTPELVEDYARDEIEIPLTTGGVTGTHRWATVSFAVGDQQVTLTVFREENDGPLFLPFRDGTAGDESYAVGRYVELHPLPDGDLWLDFNYAYNPYCAYNDQWACPIPPPENRVSAPIRAGERAYPDALH